MRPVTLAALVVAGAAAIAGGWYYGVATTPREQTAISGGGLMFPGLAAKLHDAAKLEITHQGRQTVIEKRADGGWGVASLHDYPIQDVKLRGVLTGLTELRLLEPRTGNPAEFGRLGVDDPNGAAASGDLVRLVDAGGQPIVAVIVGHRRVRSQGHVPDEVYVRRPDETQSWLAEGTLQADADAQAWLDRDILNIGQDKIASVVVGDDALVFGRVDGKFTLTRPAEHPKLEEYKVDNVARGLETLTLQSVKADADAAGEPIGRAVFTTLDGLVVKVTLLHADKDVWARFAVSGPEKVKAEADRLSARLAGWSYQVPSWKEKSLVPAIDDLKAAEPPAAAPAAAHPDAAAPAAAAPEAGAPAATAPEAAAHDTVPAAEAAAPAPAAAPPATAPEAAPPAATSPETAGPGTAGHDTAPAPETAAPAPTPPEAAAPEPGAPGSDKK
jgi:hypothetical protein